MEEYISIKKSKNIIFNKIEGNSINSLFFRFKKISPLEMNFGAKLIREIDGTEIIADDIDTDRGNILIKFKNLGLNSARYLLLLDINVIGDASKNERVMLQGLSTKDAVSLFFPDSERLISYILLDLEEKGFDNSEIYSFLNSLRKSVVMYDYKDFVNNIENNINNLKKKTLGNSARKVIEKLEKDKEDKRELFKTLGDFDV